MNYAKINWQEGLTPLSPANMNNIEQGIGQALWYGETSNSGNAFSVILSPEPSSLYPGMRISIKANADSSGQVTLDVNNLGARPVKKPNGEDVTEWKAGGVYTVVYDGLSFQLQGEGGEISSADLNVLKKRLANLTAFADIHNRVTGAQDVMYDIFETDDTNNSAGKLDTTKTTLKQAVSAGTTVLTDKINAITGQFLTGQEITICDDVNMERRLVTRGEIETIPTIRDKSAPVTLNTVASTIRQNANTQYLSNGWLVQLIYDSGVGYKIRVSKDHGASWGQLCYMGSSGFQEGGSIISDGTTLHVILPYYLSGLNVYYYKIDALTKTNTDTSHTILLQTDTGNEVNYADIVIHPTTKELLVVWSARTTTNSNSYNLWAMKSVDGGTTWTKLDGTAGVEAVTTANTAGHHYKFPSVTYKGSYFHIVCSFTDGTSQKGVINFTNAHTTKSWTSSSPFGNKVVDSGGSYDRNYPNIHMHRHGTYAGRLWCVCDGRDAVDTSHNNLRVSYSDDNGATWSTPGKITSGNSYPGGERGVFTEDKNGLLWLLFDGRDGAISTSWANVRYVTFNGSWSAITTITNNTNAHAWSPTVCDNYEDFTFPLIVWMDHTLAANRFKGVWTTYSYTTHLEVEALQNNYKVDAVVARSTVEIGYGKVTTQTTLYKDGVETIVFTGSAPYDSGWSVAGSYTTVKQLTNLEIKQNAWNSASNTSGGFVSAAIDFTNINTLRIKYTSNLTGSMKGRAVKIMSGTSPTSTAHHTSNLSEGTDNVLTIDTTLITGTCYVHIYLWSYRSTDGGTDGINNLFIKEITADVVTTATAKTMNFGKYTPRVDAYYYNLGAEFPSFVNGFSSGNNFSYATASKNADNLYAGAQGTGSTSVVIIRTWYTQIKVDLTNVATLVIDWAGSGYASGYTGEVYFAVTADTTTDPFSSSNKIGYSANFTRRENTLDVSALTGSYHLCFFCRVGQYGRADGYMYKLYAKDVQGNILKTDGVSTPFLACDARYNITPKEGSAKEFNTWIKYEKDAGFAVDNSISVVAPAENESYTAMQKKVTSLDATCDEAEFTAVTVANSKITQRITLTRSNTGIDKKVKQILGSVA